MPWNFSTTQPIYTQLVTKLQSDILAGTYEAGSKFPSVRELSAIACVNPNTMQRAFSELEHLGLIITNRTSGRTVTSDIAHLTQCREQLALEHTRDYIEVLSKYGFDHTSIIQILQNTLKGGLET